MNADIIDGIPIKHCVRCGECCKACACGFGEYDRELGQCRYLAAVLHHSLVGKGVALYECSIADDIAKDPTSVFSPAFGAGCCRNLGNPVRDHIVKVLKEGKECSS